MSAASSSNLRSATVQVRASHRTAAPAAAPAFVRSNVNPATKYRQQGKSLVARAQRTEDVDVDAVLADIADKFERADNKVAIVGYGAAAVGATVFAEWLIHLPLFNVLLGFPIQLVGLLLTPYFVVKYFLEDGDVVADAEKVVDTITKKLPGL